MGRGPQEHRGEPLLEDERGPERDVSRRTEPHLIRAFPVMEIEESLEKKNPKKHCLAGQDPSTVLKIAGIKSASV